MFIKRGPPREGVSPQPSPAERAVEDLRKAVCASRGLLPSMVWEKPQNNEEVRQLYNEVAHGIDKGLSMDVEYTSALQCRSLTLLELNRITEQVIQRRVMVREEKRIAAAAELQLKLQQAKERAEREKADQRRQRREQAQMARLSYDHGARRDAPRGSSFSCCTTRSIDH